MKELLAGFLKTLLALIAALAVVALLLFAFFRIVIAPSQSSSAQAPRTSSGFNLREIVLDLRLAGKGDALKPVSQDSDAPTVAFEVTAGETAADVALRLQNNGLIRDAEAFRLLMQQAGLDRNIEAGRFELSPAMSAEQIAQALQHANPTDITVAIIEGWRLEQSAASLGQALGLGNDIGVLAAQNASALMPAWVGKPAEVTSLEGFLYPDTYRFDPDISADAVVQQMLQNFEAHFTESMRQQATAKNLTPYQVVIIASIVEREAMVAEERPLIAAAFLNRLNQNMRLEADPTVQYALGYQSDTNRWWKVPLLGTDLQTAVSPYNTYLNTGLPPTPICSPGIASIEAVLNPANVDYLYFVAKGDGSHAFTASFDEHLQNVAKYQGG